MSDNVDLRFGNSSLSMGLDAADFGANVAVNGVFMVHSSEFDLSNGADSGSNSSAFILS
jgi:hypothetical protein